MLGLLCLDVGTAGAQGTPISATPARVIVKFRSSSSLLAARAVSEKAALANRAAVVGERIGLTLGSGAAIAPDMQVVVAAGMSSVELAERLAGHSDLEFAVPDERRHAMMAPNDTLYATGGAATGPLAGQWYLRAPAGELQSAINAEAAWNITTGDPAVVVAVLDSGIRFDHPDLAANVLPGYDMISAVDTANDGDGRDPDPSDPGDWVTQQELSEHDGPFYQCAAAPRDSSWHGTQTAALIAAVTDNGFGMASVGRTVRVVPVRVLGKCGGFDSDIIAGMRWAAGLSVPGVPVNPNPARILNMSLGGGGTCNSAYRQAFSQLTAMGAVVVVAAGNDAGHAVSSPGNCPGALTVGALRHVGTKVGFSNVGAEVDISAPGGNCVNIAPGTACLYPILTASNTGTTTPADPTFTDSYKISVGTSFAVPLVAGTVALMRSVAPSLTVQQVIGTLQSTARPFPTTGADASSGPVGACTVPQYDTAGAPVDQLECYCSTAVCGAGMLDTGAALAALTKSSVAVQTVIEFYNHSLDHYFITWVPGEVSALDGGTIPGWVRTGYSFKTYGGAQAGASPVCRYYIPPPFGDSHFFGRGAAECAATGTRFPGFVLEDPQFMSMVLPTAGTCPAATVPVYRVFDNRADANHRYMTDRAVRAQMVALGWTAEGDGSDQVVMCAPQ